ncbi:hypothetical protein MKX03_012575 [Papaver bracteatum]|nr:hypothetical protein MKX03_012575 [Papaver bracteatum]
MKPLVGFLVFALIGLSITLQMQSGTAISCKLGETIVNTATKVPDCDVCRKDLHTKCGLQGRVVTKEKLCEGCCQVPLPCPVQPPVKWWGTCAATDINKTFKIERYTGNNCHPCQDGCKTRCDAIGARVGDQICGYLTNGKTNVGYHCTCYIYMAFRLSNPNSCSSCSSDCKVKCSQMGSSMTKQQCNTESSPRLCKCCCKTPPPYPSPPPPSPSPPPPSPSPPPPSPSPPPPSPPPPPKNICDDAGEKFSQITHYGTKDCSVCQSDCQAQCSANSLTKQMCTIKPTSLSCQCCCKSNTWSTSSLLSLATE